MKESFYNTGIKWQIEMLWWLITTVIVVLIMTPIFTNLGNSYPFYLANIIFIIVFITLTRYIFLLKYTLFSHATWVKALFVFLPIPLFLYCIDSLYDFQRFLDEEGLISIMDELSSTSQTKLAKYIQYEKLLFGSGAILTLVMFPLRMIVSIWRVRNRGTV